MLANRIYFSGFGVCPGLRGSSPSGRQTYGMDELLPVKKTVLFSNLVSLELLPHIEFIFYAGEAFFL